MKSLKISASLLFIAVLTASCAESKTAAPKGPTKAEFVKQANAVCADQQEKFNKLFETDFPVVEERLPQFFKKAAPILKAQVDGLRELEPPAADEKKIKALIATGDRAVADFEDATTDLEKGKKLFDEEGGENSNKFDEDAKAYGLTKCAEDEDEEEEKVDASKFSADKKAYIEKADAVCKKYNDQIHEAEDQAFQSFPPKIEAWADFLPKAVAIEKQGIEELRALSPPAEDADKIKGILDERAETIAIAEEAIPLAAAKDVDAFADKAGELFSGFEDNDATQREYGFQECGSGDEEEGNGEGETEN
ncbi:MAG: hypothetical protein ACRDIU_00515 [Actinomycetota bacterium]